MLSWCSWAPYGGNEGGVYSCPLRLLVTRKPTKTSHNGQWGTSCEAPNGNGATKLARTAL